MVDEPSVFEPLKFYCILYLFSIYTVKKTTQLAKERISVPGVCNYGYVPLSYLGNIVVKMETTTQLTSAELSCGAFASSTERRQ